MTPPVAVRQAGPQDFDTVMQLLRRRIDWLRSRGSDQWSTWHTWADKIPTSLEAGHVWILSDDTDVIGTVSLEFKGDPDFWTPEECAVPAGYVSKLAIRTDRAGGELGALLLEWLGEYAYRRGCLSLRLDAWKTNSQLHAYYRQRGWMYLRTVDRSHRNSGALFERPARPMSEATASLLKQPGLALLNGVSQSGYGGDGRLGPDHGNWSPGHTHDGGMVVKYPFASQPGPPLLVDFLQYRVTQRESGWQMQTQGGGRLWHNDAMVLSAPFPLENGWDYVITHQGQHPACRLVMVAVPTDLVDA